MTAHPVMSERTRRRRARRRVAREQLAVVAFLVVALIVTLIILGRIWLDSGGPVTTNSNAMATLTLRGGSA